MGTLKLMEYNGPFICCYSDQRDEAYGQKLTHQTLIDWRNWSSAVADVAHKEYAEHPGTQTVPLMPNGKYILFFENVGGPSTNSGVPSCMSFLLSRLIICLAYKC